MNKTKEKQVTTKGVCEVLKELLKTHIVGVVQKEEGNGFDFYIPGGKLFRISVEEK